MAKHTTNTHTESPLPLSFSLGWTQFSGWLSFICCHRAHTSIVSSSSVFRGRFSSIANAVWNGFNCWNMMLEKRVYIWACFRTRTGTSSRTMLSLTEQNRTEQDIPLQVISRICYARVAACDNNNYNCNYINCNITEWASEHVRERGRGTGRCERWPCYILSDRLRDSEMCVWASVSAAAAAAAVVAAEA